MNLQGQNNSLLVMKKWAGIVLFISLLTDEAKVPALTSGP